VAGPVTLDLREGFEADEVTVRAAGAADIELHAVKTRMQLGLAHSLPLALPDDTARIEIELPRRGVRAAIELLPDRPLWVGASLSRDGHRLEVEQQLEPFRYA
jgi:hypothetical protein